jgi:hypothetical protein
VVLPSLPGDGRRHLQAAHMIGGRPPRSVEVEECTISDVFSKLSDVKNNLDCQAGCEQGTGACPENWYPSAADECSPACGEVFEPFVSRPQAIASCTANCCLKLSALNRLLRACCCCVLQWDQCGEMLVAAGMGGLDQMSAFYDHCLVALYVQP